MKQLFRSYFTFNKRERNGIFVLLSIIIVLISYLSITDHFIQTDTVDFKKFEKEMQALNNTAIPEIQEEHPAINEKPVAIVERFPFDPNNLSEEKWKALGLTEKQIRSIKKYESKGGKFKNKEDVKKMFLISPQLYAELEPYIHIPIRASIKPEPSVNKKVYQPVPVLELNSADSAQLTTMKGIGPYFAKSIIKYRNALGGFYKKEQLLEVWKFEKEKYEVLKTLICVDSSKIHQININTCTAEQLKHPYLRWNMVNAIINYRTKHGNYGTIEEVKKCGLIDEATFERMAPYLNVWN